MQTKYLVKLVTDLKCQFNDVNSEQVLAQPVMISDYNGTNSNLFIFEPRNIDHKIVMYHQPYGSNDPVKVEVFWTKSEIFSDAELLAEMIDKVLTFYK